MQIVTVVFDGPSPADQLLCPAHAPRPAAAPPGRIHAGTSLKTGLVPFAASPDLVTGA
jgi:hypothetical protein